MISIRNARKAGVPLVVVETADPGQTMLTIVNEINGKAKDIPILRWDIVRSLQGLNDKGAEVASGLGDATATQNPTECLNLLQQVPGRSVVFFLNAHRYWDNEAVVQAIWNLRDPFKSTGSCLVLLTVTGARIPMELQNDVIKLEDTLPTEDELTGVIQGTVEDAKKAGFKGEIDTPRVRDSLLGLSGFQAEQVFAMSFSKEGIDKPTLDARCITTIEATDGLSVYRGKESKEQIGGMMNAQKVFGSIITGLGIRHIGFVDEIDKAMAASRTDTSGVTQDQSKVFLSWMQDNDIPGALLLGPPGTGKTYLMKVLANMFDLKLIMFDLGAAKGSLVGESEGKIRKMVRVAHAISGGKILMVGACNRTESLPPELRRRFNLVSMFMDLATDEEKKIMWQIYIRQFALKPEQIDTVSDAGWTGAEIRNCCLKAWAMKAKLSEAAKTIVPISVSAAEEVEGLRRAASGKYISASYEGLYRYRVDQTPKGRKVDMS